jgi:hypothetical protein
MTLKDDFFGTRHTKAHCVDKMVACIADSTDEANVKQALKDTGTYNIDALLAMNDDHINKLYIKAKVTEGQTTKEVREEVSLNTKIIIKQLH